MPAPDGLLTSEERERALAWLNSKLKGGDDCPVCKENTWALGGHLIQANIFRGGMTFIGGPSYPMAFLVCVNCAYVRHFMAVQMGIITPPPPPSDTGGTNVG